MAAVNLVDTKQAYNYQRMYDNHHEGEEQIISKHKHSSIDLKREIKDIRLKNWIREEQLEFLHRQLYCLKYSDLKSITDDEVEALITSANLEVMQAKRFRNAITFLRTRGSLQSQKSLNTTTKYDDIFKLILVGDCKVGKTSIINRFVKDEFESFYQETIALNCHDHIIEMPSKNVKLQIFDTSGAHQFGTISRAFFRDAHGVLLIYDMTNITSFNNIEKWIGRVNMQIDQRSWKMLVANKLDIDDQRVITKQTGQELANDYNMKFMECSAKLGDHIDAIFYIVCQYLLTVWDKPTSRHTNHNNNNGGCCCNIL